MTYISNRSFYLLKKIATASFTLLIFLLVVTITSSLSLFDISKLLQSYWLWFAFYIYAPICSIIIDRLTNLLLERPWISPALYCLFGFLPFIFIFIEEIGFIIIAGIVGIGVALLYYIGWKVVTKHKLSIVFFALVIPILFIIVVNYDFTKKEDWQVTRDHNQYEVTFSYFNGEHKIPIDLEKGDKISYSLTVNAKNSGGWGNHFENGRGKYMPMTENGEYLEYVASHSERYYIVVSGHGVSGNFTVDWDIIKNK